MKPLAVRVNPVQRLANDGRAFHLIRGHLFLEHVVRHFCFGRAVADQLRDDNRSQNNQQENIQCTRRTPPFDAIVGLLRLLIVIG